MIYAYTTQKDAQSIGAVNDAARSVDRRRETARQHPARRRICNSTGIRPLPITGTRAQRSSNRKSWPTRRGVCSTLHTLNCFNQNAKDAPIRIGASFQRGFASGIAGFERLIGVLSRVPERNAMPACIRACQGGTPCRHAFGIARAERLVSMHSRLPERNALSACIRVCRSRTERPQARRDRLRRESTRSPAGWERRTRGPRSPDQGRRAPWRRCRTASCETPASRRCPLPPAAPK